MNKSFKFTLPSPNFNKNAQDLCKPKPHYLTPSGMSLLPREKQPPPMYGKHGATLPPRYLNRQTVQGEQTLTTNPPEKHYCEPCEIELNSIEDLKRHRAQHEKCPVEGCLYKGHPCVMDKHINALHASGLFDKFKKLSSPEEIAAWREERRKRYPTLANVLLKQKAKEQRQKRGERLESNNNRFGKINDKKRAQLNVPDNNNHTDEKKPRQENRKISKNNRKRKNNNRAKNLETTPKVQISENRKMFEDDKLSCCGINMFKGTSQLKDYKHFTEKKVVTKNALFGLVGMYGSDDESSSNESHNENEIENSRATNDIEGIETIVNNSLIENCLNDQNDINELQDRCLSTNNNTDYNSENQSLKIANESFNSTNYRVTEQEDTSLTLGYLENKARSDSNEPCNQKHNSTDDEAPEETPIQRNAPDLPSMSQQDKKVGSLNESENKCKAPKTERRVIPKRSKKFGLDYRKARLRKQNTMLEKLLESDIRHERNVLLQCVRFVCENKFFGIGQKQSRQK